MRTTTRLAFLLLLVARQASAQTRPPPDLATATLEDLMAIVVTTASRASELDAFLTIENALDRRYRTPNLSAYTNPDELIGAPQNPRRVSIGFSLRVPGRRAP